MTSEELAKVFHARRSGRGRWRAKCPAHRSTSLTLAIYASKERTSITCHAGCHSDEVLATVGLTWRDTLYNDSRLTPEEKKAWAKKKYIAALYEREQKVQELKWLLSIIEKHEKYPHQRMPTKSAFEVDIESFCKRLERKLGLV